MTDQSAAPFLRRTTTLMTIYQPYGRRRRAARRTFAATNRFRTMKPLTSAPSKRH